MSIAFDQVADAPNTVVNIETAHACDFCNLPISGHAALERGEPEYCCYGCRFAASLAAAGGDEGLARWTMTKLGLAIFFSMNVMVCTLLLWSEQADQNERFSEAWYGLFRHAGLIFSLPVLFLLGKPLLDDAWGELRVGKASMSALLVSGVAAATLYSTYSVLFGGHVYFEVACTILVGVTLGKWLEANGKLQTTHALRGMAKLLPDQVRLIRDGLEQWIPTPELQRHDHYRVLPGERIVADGEIRFGEATIDEQAVTGESVPVFRTIGRRVLSGTLVLDGPLTIEATSPAGEGTMARMIAAVQQGAQARSHYERLAERISRWFLPAVAAIAIATLIVHAGRGNVEQGMLAATAVLVIACPCSLGLATPMALWAAIGRAAEQGILIRDGDALARFAQVETICFDKTGTLSTGQAHVTALNVVDADSRETVESVAAGLTVDSNHPLSLAIYHHIADRSTIVRSFDSVRHLAGRGIQGECTESDVVCYLGNRRWLEACGQDCSRLAVPSSDEVAETLIAWGSFARGQFLLSEQLRPDVASSLQHLGAEHLHMLMLTGDREARARHLAAELGLQYHAELLPEDKPAAIAQLPPNLRPVAMVGDGINDAPALAAADVGIALGSGSDIARHTAGICLLGNDLGSLPFLRRLAASTVHTIRWNLTWALVYNIVGIGLAISGRLHPVIAAIAMLASGLFVTANSLMLARFEERSESSLDAPQSLPELQGSAT